MANSFFAFKKFIVHQDRCAMKVGTDGVLLGAWTDVRGRDRILDVGCGTGLVALMIAQRCDASVWGVELDGNAAEQAEQNAADSPWRDRIHIRQGDFKDFRWDKKFDLIVSNPPYFKNSLHSPDRVRNAARHDNHLTFYDLITKAAALLNPGGCLSLIVPVVSEDEIMCEAAKNGLFLLRRTYVKTTPDAPAKRLLVTFGLSVGECFTDCLTVELSRHVYSPEFMGLTNDYYLEK